MSTGLRVRRLHDGPTRNWTYAKPGWLEPLDQYLSDPKLTNPEYDHADFFPLLREANMWDKTVGGGIGKGTPGPSPFTSRRTWWPAEGHLRREGHQGSYQP